MMLPGAEKPPAAADPGGDPWDQKTLEWFTKLDRISLRITHMERRYKAGPGAPWGVNYYGNPETIATGFLNEAPQHVHVEIEFKNASPEFGGAYLTYQMDVDHTSGPINARAQSFPCWISTMRSRQGCSRVCAMPSLPGKASPRPAYGRRLPRTVGKLWKAGIAGAWM